MSDVYLWETYDKLGREALERRNFPQAAEAFKSAVATAEEIGAHDRLVLSLRNLAATMVDLGQVGDAYELLNRTLEVAQGALGEEHSQTVETQRDLAGTCRDLGFLEKAEGHLSNVLQQELKQNAGDQICSTLLSMAQLAQARNDSQQASQYYERVVRMKVSAHGEDHPEVAQALIWLSTSQFQSGRQDEATASLHRAFGLLERQYASEPTHLAQSLLAGAKMLVEAGQAEQALSHQKRALNLLAGSLEPDNPRLWETREQIAATLAGLGKVEEAIELLEFNLRNRGPEAGPHLGANQKNLAGLYLTLGQTEKAEELYSKASAIFEETLGKEHPAYLATQEERIQMYHVAGRAEEALQLALQTISATEKRFGAGHPNTAQAYASTSLLAHQAGQWETALELMRAAEKIWLSLSPRPEDVLANCRANIATCLLKMKRFDEAEAALDLAEQTAGPSLGPVVAQLRAELSTNGQERMGDAVEESASTPEADEGEDEFALPDVGAADDDEFALPDVAGDIPVFPDPSGGELQFGGDEEGDGLFGLDEEDDPFGFEAGGELLGASEPATFAAVPTPEEQSEPNSEPEPEPADALTSVASEQIHRPAVEPVVEPVEDPAEEAPSEAASVTDATSVSDHNSPDPEPRPTIPGTGEYVERRAAPRAPLSLNQIFDLEVAASGDGGTNEVRSFLVDLGPGGIRINSETPIPPEGEVTLILPEDVLGSPASLKAEVVWQRTLYGASYLQGLSFKELTPKQEEILARTLKAANGQNRAKSRQHFRLYRTFPIKLQAEGQQEWIASYATDLSVNGLGTRLKDSLEQGNDVRLRLELEFELPTVEVAAKVAWSRSGENGVSHGLQFDTVGPVEAKTIKRYIDHCLEFLPD